MNHCDFCAEYAHETNAGAIKFSKPIVNRFIKRYTYFKPEDFTPRMLERLRLIMVDYYMLGLESIKGVHYPEEKIVLPDFIFQ